MIDVRSKRHEQKIYDSPRPLTQFSTPFFLGKALSFGHACSKKKKFRLPLLSSKYLSSSGIHTCQGIAKRRKSREQVPYLYLNRANLRCAKLKSKRKLCARITNLNLCSCKICADFGEKSKK